MESVDTPVEFYDRWVNGAGLRTFAALQRRRPAGVRVKPGAVKRPGDPAAPELSLSLPKYDGPLDLPSLDADRLHPIAHVIIHGSQATNDACGFSDVDLVAIVDDLNEYDEERCADAALELQRLLAAVYSYDRLMHHGLMFYPASALNAYDQFFLPVETFRRAQSLHGPSNLVLRLRTPERPRLRERVVRSIGILRAHLRDESFDRNDFTFKQFLSNVLLMPALLAAAKGEYLYKRDSFEAMRPQFSASTWAGIARAESMRLAWRRSNAGTVQRLLRETTHPCVQLRWAQRKPPKDNLSLLRSGIAAQWRDELEKTFARIEEVA